jgi:hypothetical protein
MGTRRVSPSALCFSARRSRDLPLSVHRVPPRLVEEHEATVASVECLVGCVRQRVGPNQISTWVSKPLPARGLPPAAAATASIGGQRPALLLGHQGSPGRRVAVVTGPCRAHIPCVRGTGAPVGPGGITLSVRGIRGQPRPRLGGCLERGLQDLPVTAKALVPQPADPPAHLSRAR